MRRFFDFEWRFGFVRALSLLAAQRHADQADLPGAMPTLLDATACRFLQELDVCLQTVGEFGQSKFLEVLATRMPSGLRRLALRQHWSNKSVARPLAAASPHVEVLDVEGGQASGRGCSSPRLRRVRLAKAGRSLRRMVLSDGRPSFVSSRSATGRRPRCCERTPGRCPPCAR